MRDLLSGSPVATGILEAGKSAEAGSSGPRSETKEDFGESIPRNFGLPDVRAARLAGRSSFSDQGILTEFYLHLPNRSL